MNTKSHFVGVFVFTLAFSDSVATVVKNNSIRKLFACLNRLSKVFDTMRRKGELTRNELELNQIKRRRFATRLNEKEVGMRTIQKLMGHRHIGTTALYCEVSDTMMRNAVEVGVTSEIRRPSWQKMLSL